MNGIHDLGGMHGFGPVVAELDEPVFHLDWERRAFALMMAMSPWRLGNFRSAVEHMPPDEYLASSYYEHWLFALEFLLERSDLVEPEELKRVRDEPHTVPPAAATPHVRDGAFRPEDARALAPSRGVRLEDSNVVAARFEPGQTVVARNIHPVGHTRLPRYARGRRGVIERDNGVSPFPDTTERRPQHVYSVRFEARELWGPGAAESDRIYIDLWDEYLDAG